MFWAAVARLQLTTTVLALALVVALCVAAAGAARSSTTTGFLPLLRTASRSGSRHQLHLGLKGSASSLLQVCVYVDELN